MAEYISREALYKEVTEKYCDIVAGPYPYNIVAHDMARLVEEAPAADVVEVVRCKDCRYWDECKIGEGLCEHPVNGITRDYTIGCDYCSYGERKKDNDN